MKEISTLLGISRTSTYEFVNNGEVKAVRIGASIRISKRSFDERLDGQVTKLLRFAFKQAVVAQNPFDFVTLPKVVRKRKDIWTAETIRKAFDS